MEEGSKDFHGANVLGLDLSEILIIMVVALIVFGPDNLPEIARELGKWMGQMRRTADSVRREFYNELYPPAQELRRDFLESSQELRAVGKELRNLDDRASPPARSEKTGERAAAVATAAVLPEQVPAFPDRESPTPDAAPKTNNSEQSS
ncbi:MAG: twin-arginine translocase subunit TatB [Proteobacteria bacterium]|nr:twin-arginine translocase subunit TatB [Pseudomonadota bacterium]